MTNAELAILSLLAERPRHGYEIEQVIAERDMREWTDIGFSSIYYLLRKLADRGLVTARAEEPEDGRATRRGGGASPRRGPARKVYAPTPAGFAACGEATAAALSTPRAPNAFLLGLGNIAHLPAEEAASALRAYRDSLDERLARLTRRREAAAGAPRFVDDLFDYSMTMAQTEHAWVASLLGRYEREASEVFERKVGTGPEIVEMPARRMAVVRTTGDPNELGERVFKALYGSVYTLKFARKKQGADFKMSPPRARWFAGESWREVPREQWEAAWAMPVPDDVDEVPQKVPEPPVGVETWEYGTVAQILHVGAYAEEEPTIARLHAFIAEQGFEIAGPHEEEYLSRPGARKPKTVIRYQVRKL